MARTQVGQIATRRVAILIADGVDGADVSFIERDWHFLCGSPVLSMCLGAVTTAQGEVLAVDGTLATMPSVIFDAVYLPEPGVAEDLPWF